jgi:hypothetical protein
LFGLWQSRNIIPEDKQLGNWVIGQLGAWVIGSSGDKATGRLAIREWRTEVAIRHSEIAAGFATLHSST